MSAYRICTDQISFAIVKLSVPGDSETLYRSGHMVFKVIFADGSSESIHANTVADARTYARRQFHNRVVARVERAGLMDMATRPPASAIKPSPSKQ
jgi:flavin-binding protein dodecin